MDTTAQATEYAAHPRYKALAGVCAAMAALFGWQLRQGIDVGALLFLGAALALMLWYVRSWGSRVTLEPRRLRLQRPLDADTVVEFRQLAGVSEEGRFGQSILLHYHPLAADGRVELEEIRSLALPALQGQAALLEILTQQTPP
ncbi:MAG: hypothetical protein IT329_01165 [Caldilineaceae bacterium]|nr:hypothetical protein [Caldilineaceae bacterium]